MHISDPISMFSRVRAFTGYTVNTRKMTFPCACNVNMILKIKNKFNSGLFEQIFEVRSYSYSLYNITKLYYKTRCVHL